jgi:hypothetical protein
LRNKKCKVTDIWLAGTNFKRQSALAATLERKYGGRKPAPKR